MGFLSKGQKQNHKIRCVITFVPPQCPSQYQEHDRVQVREHQLDKSYVLSLKDPPMSAEGAGCSPSKATLH